MSTVMMVVVLAVPAVLIFAALRGMMQAKRAPVRVVSRRRTL
ncbi:hypothetical protein ABLE91_08905 [Aquabacter sp. CN5-332]